MCHIQESEVRGGARPRTAPRGDRTTGRSRRISMHRNNEDEFSNPILSECVGARNTSGLKIRPGVGVLCAIWESPISSGDSLFFACETSGARAFNPNNATNAMTQGINTVRTGRLSEELMQACRWAADLAHRLGDVAELSNAGFKSRRGGSPRTCPNPFVYTDPSSYLDMKICFLKWVVSWLPSRHATG